MIGPADLALGAAAGALAAPVLCVVAGVCLMAYNMQGYIVDDATRAERLRVTVDVTPRYVYYETDWRALANALPYAAAAGAAAVTIALVFVAGLLSIAG